MALGYLHTSTCHPRAWKTILETVPDDSALLVMIKTAHPADTDIHVHLKTIEYCGNVFNSKSDTFIYFRIITHKVACFKPFCFDLDDYGLQLMEINNPVSQYITIKHLQYRNVDLRRALISYLTLTLLHK